jgi:hypothetical protein
LGREIAMKSLNPPLFFSSVVKTDTTPDESWIGNGRRRTAFTSV